MSVSAADVKRTKDYINTLPDSISTDDVRSMHAALLKDLNKLPGSKTTPNTPVEQALHHKHKLLSIAYPQIFFRTVRGEVDAAMLDKLLSIRQDMEKGRIDMAEARNRVVDGAKAQIQDPALERRNRKPNGGDVSEFKLKVRADDP